MSVTNEFRRERIREYVLRNRHAGVQDLSAELNASEATIRRDIQALGREAGFKRLRGGITIDESRPELPVIQRGRLMSGQKRAIGRKAADLVRDGEVIFLGSGSTTVEVARSLTAHKDITVITNSLPIVLALMDNPRIELVVAGGALRRPELSLIGHIVEGALSELRADKVIIGIQGLHPTRGLTNEFLPEAILDRQLVHFAAQLIVVADSSKLGKIKASFVGNVADISVLVTDRAADPQIIDELQRQGVRVELADEPSEEPADKPAP